MHARHFLDFQVDGRSLHELAPGVGDQVRPLCNEWREASVENAIEVLRSRRASTDSRLNENESELLVCAECGDVGCGAVVASVEFTDEAVTWHRFRWVQDGDAPENEWPLDVEGAPFVFNRQDYEQLLAGAAQRVASLAGSGTAVS